MALGLEVSPLVLRPPWLASFLNNRVAKVRFGDATSKCRIMRQGLPQGSVLSPLLFILYINNLAKILPDSETIVMFADDVEILCTHRVKEEAEKRAQGLVDIVVKWSAEWKLTLNSGKSEAAFFSTWTKPEDVEWQPQITIEGETIPLKAHPRLL